ncbi:MAG: hypothetical protein E6Q34_07290 [Burkholderiaceae bacterium]|nr:MAG: hypothetical protein E6Q34_07290 [Burkholderiaceae bacterium]
MAFTHRFATNAVSPQTLRFLGAKVQLTCVLFSLCILSACGGSGGGSTSTPSSPTNTNTPTVGVVDLTQNKLLSDSELSVNMFPNLPAPKAETATWLATQHQKLRSLTYDGDFSDLTFLEPLLRNKRIVQLGESSHGTREFSQAKVRLIKYLHEKLGYDVIAFESSMIGCYLQEQELVMGKSFKVNESCIFGVWSTSEVQELFSYIERTHKTTKPLRLAGFDEQSSGWFDDAAKVRAWIEPILLSLNEPKFAGLPRFVEESIKLGQDGAMCPSNRSSSSCTNFLANHASNTASLASFAALLKPYADAAKVGENTPLQMAYLTVLNVQKRLEVLKNGVDQPGYFEPRDKAMADNISELAKAVYPQEKIIVWAHNAHISHGISGYNGSGRTMGNFLLQTWGGQLYSIGLFMLRGETANNDRTIMNVQMPLPDSLEAYASSLKLAAFILPLPNSDQAGTGDDWIFQPINFYVWGGFLTAKAPIGQQFNAVLFVDHSSMPQYVK